MPTFTADEIKRILAPLAEDEVFQRLHSPAFRPEFGEEPNGDPALLIYVLIPDEVTPERAGGPHLEERQRIRETLWNAGWDAPVYARFRSASDDPLPLSVTAAK
jgi:hypothetical protein